MIGCKYAPDIDDANLQGVHSDSLESFRSVGKVGVGETPMLRAFFARSVGNCIICILAHVYTQSILSFIILCELSEETVVQ